MGISYCLWQFYFMFFINFKTYESGTGAKGLEMAKIVEKVSRESGIEMAVVVQAVDVRMIAEAVLVPVWCQHVDAMEYGAHTGWVLPEAVKEAGAVGVLLNHSEHKVLGIQNPKFEIRNPKQIQNSKFKIQNEGSLFGNLNKTVDRCREVGLKTLVCAAGVEEFEEVLKADSDYVAYEPPELIGSREQSVSTAKPEVVQKVVEIAGQTPVLIGAGIHAAEDIRVGLELGASGFLISSDVMLADDPEEELQKLMKGYNSQ